MSNLSMSKHKNDTKNQYKSSNPYWRTKQHKDNCLLEFTDQAMAHQEADNHSNKIFILKPPGSCKIQWQLPLIDQLYIHPVWKDAELQAMKDNLNKVKGQLENYDIEIWHQHTHAVNPAVNIPLRFRNMAKPELLTQAFLKFYEILHKFPIVPSDASVFRSLHLCEAPGAFVVALNHYLGVNHPTLRLKWNWLGNTLNPYFEGTPTSECISDDRFILHTLENWLFGKDQTGNLMSMDYLQELEEYYKGCDVKVQLVSADGSIDCQGNPAEQETMTHRLHFCEVYAGISILAEGGSLILKKFTFFEAESVNLLYFICCAFEEVAIYKPITSKLGNSEVYVVALKYNCTDTIKEYLKELRKFYGTRHTTTMFSKEQIPSSFISNVKNCSSFFKENQVTAIKRNIELYKSDSQMKWDYNEFLKKLVVQRFYDSNNCNPLCISDRIIPNKKLEWDRHVYPHTSLKWGEQIMNKSKVERLEFLNNQFESLTYEHSSISIKLGIENDKFITHEIERCPSLAVEFNLILGKAFDLVYISRLCHATVLQVYIHYFKESTPHLEFKLTNSVLFDAEYLERFTYDKKEEVFNIIKGKDYYPKSLILDEGNFAGPHNKCHSLESLLSHLKHKKIEEGEDVILFNIPLLTRLQSGLFVALCSIFSKVIFYYRFSNDKSLLWPPFIVLSKFRSRHEGRILYENLSKNGWCEGAANKGIHEVVSVAKLVKSPLYPYICNYNALSCLWHIKVLKCTQTNSSMKNESNAP